MGLKLTIPPTESDPLGIAKVSGFYGNGTWAGWFLTLLTSWYGIFSKPGSNNYHDVFLHLLYTNWAAVDVFRQLYKLRSLSAEARERQNPIFGAIAAAFTITFWGALHAVFQLKVCISAGLNRRIEQAARKSLWRRCTILVYGLVLPSSALVAFLFGLPDLGDMDYGIANVIPALYYHDMGEFFHFYVLQGACAVGHWIVVQTIFLIRGKWDALTDVDMEQLPMITHCFAMGIFLFTSHNYRWLGLMPLWWFPIWLPWILVVVVLLYFVAFAASPLLAIRYISKIIVSGGKTVSKSCFFMPCAPQGIADWDQIFPLLCGLAMFMYEVGPGIIKFLGRGKYQAVDQK